jgi:hypothetical protein
MQQSHADINTTISDHLFCLTGYPHPGRVCGPAVSSSIE